MFNCLSGLPPDPLGLAQVKVNQSLRGASLKPQHFRHFRFQRPLDRKRKPRALGAPGMLGIVVLAAGPPRYLQGSPREGEVSKGQVTIRVGTEGE